MKSTALPVERAFDQHRGDGAELLRESIDRPARKEPVGHRPIVSVLDAVHRHHRRLAAAFRTRGIEAAHRDTGLIGKSWRVANDRDHIRVTADHPDAIDEHGFGLERLPIAGPLVPQFGEQIERQASAPGIAIGVKIGIENAEIAHTSFLTPLPSSRSSPRPRRCRATWSRASG